jgi:hypothetical protein
MESLFDHVLRDLAALARVARTSDDARMADEHALADLVDALVRESASRGDTLHGASISGASINQVASAYRALGARSRTRHHLLRLLAASGERAALAAFADLLAADPPAQSSEVALAFAPLLQHRVLHAEALFPKLWDCLEQPATAVLVLDLANFICRRGHMAVHPAAPRVARLAALLVGLVNRLARLQEHPEEFGRTPAALATIVGESMGLVVALCDALALIGDTSVTGKLHQALELTHRRVRTEAAFALARLGDDAGVDALAQMAAEPSARSRALAYLDELGLTDRASEADRSPASRAEGELAAWLAQPDRLGLPPSAIELIDSRRQHWPGFAEMVDCYLFRYEYVWRGRTQSNIAIVGPALHSIAADLADLPPADIYAAYAGWSAEHEEIDETAADALSPAQQAAWRELRLQLLRGGFDDLRPVKCARFFGEIHWVATARRGDQPGILVYDGTHAEWHASGVGNRPLGPTEIYQIYKGRKLLRAFNSKDVTSARPRPVP